MIASVNMPDLGFVELTSKSGIPRPRCLLRVPIMATESTKLTSELELYLLLHQHEEIVYHFPLYSNNLSHFTIFFSTLTLLCERSIILYDANSQ